MVGALVDDLARRIEIFDPGDGDGGRLVLRPLQKTVLDQPARPTTPGHVGAHAQVGLLGIDERPGSGVAKLEGDRVFGPGDARDDPDHRLIRAEAGSDLGVAPLAIAQVARFRRRVVHRADVDQLVTPGFGDQPAGFLRRQPQLLAVDRIGEDGARAGAEILQLERKDRNSD